MKKKTAVLKTIKKFHLFSFYNLLKKSIDYVSIFVARNDEEGFDVVISKVTVPISSMTRFNSVVTTQVAKRLFCNVDSPVIQKE